MRPIALVVLALLAAAHAFAAGPGEEAQARKPEVTNRVHPREPMSGQMKRRGMMKEQVHEEAMKKQALMRDAMKKEQPKR